MKIIWKNMYNFFVLVIKSHYNSALDYDIVLCDIIKFLQMWQLVSGPKQRAQIEDFESFSIITHTNLLQYSTRYRHFIQEVSITRLIISTHVI